jgi:ArsR family transcriptional regulator
MNIGIRYYMDLDKFLQIVKIITDQTRLRILHLLSHRELAVKDICLILNMSQPVISRHLIKLKLLDIVVNMREGATVNYSLNTENKKTMNIIDFLLNECGSFDVFEQDLKNLETM